MDASVPSPASIATRKAAALAFAVPGGEVDARRAGLLVGRSSRQGGQAVVGPLGIVVARLGEIIVHVFATTRPVPEALAVVAEVACHPSVAVVVNASRDERTNVTLVHAQSRICDLIVARPHIEAMMNAAFVRLAVDEITAAVAASATASTTENRQDQP